MNYQYRAGTLADDAQLRRLGLNAYGQFSDVLSGPNQEKLHHYLTEENTYTALLTCSECFVCETKGEIVGMAFLIPSGNPTDIFPTDWSYIRMVGVHTSHSGQGIGRTLTLMCVDRAIASGERVIGLHTSEFMDAARHIYESMGFRQVKELEPRLGKIYWLYALDL